MVELAAATELLGTARLVTIAGPGGVGKTCLALEVARALHRNGDGVWLAELASASSAEQVTSALAAAVRLARPPGATRSFIVDYASQHRGLLLVDNCEHVVDEIAAFASVVLSSCEQLRVLVTSRATLNVSGEHVLRLGGLEGDAASELLVTRARAANRLVALDPAVVRRVTERLEGLPLAIELAAARTASLTLEQIDDALGRLPLDLLSGDRRASHARHRTIRAVIGWSYDLLSERDQTALGELAVFTSPFTIEAARSLVGDDALDVVDRLVCRSLLMRASDLAGEATYRMLEVLRQFARDGSPPLMVAKARNRHLQHHVELARSMADGLRTAAAPRWAAIGRAHVTDLRVAAENALAQRSSAAGQLVVDLYWPWFLDGRLTELRAWSEQARHLTSDPRAYARLDRVIASTSVAQGDVLRAEQAARRQLDAGRRLGDELLIALAHNLLGMAAWARRDPSADHHHSEARQHALHAGEPWSLVLITALAGHAAHLVGDHDRGDVLLGGATRLGEQLGEPMVLGCALDYEAHAAYAADRPEANVLYERALSEYRTIGYQEGVASAATLGATIAVLAGRRDDADALLREALDVCERLGHLGGQATVYEATALLQHERGDYEAASPHSRQARSSAVRAAPSRRRNSRTRSIDSTRHATREGGTNDSPEADNAHHRLRATPR